MSRKRFWSWLAIVIGGVAVCELCVRFVESAIGAPTGSLYDLVVQEGARFKLRPNARIVVPERYGSIEYRINSLGYRDDEPRPRGAAPRVVLLGDSVAFGLGARQGDIFAMRCERVLRSEFPAADLVNLATFAYHSGNELQALREDGLRWEPDLVVVQFYLNDLAYSGERPSEGGEAIRPTLGQILQAAKNRILFSSSFYRRVHQAGARASYLLLHDLRRRHPAWLNHDEPRTKLELLLKEPRDENVPALVAIAEMASLARAANAAFLLVLSPDEVQLFDTRYDGIQDRMRSFAARYGIQVLDLLPALREEPDRVELFLDGVHLSSLGHQRAAEALAPLLLDALSRSAANGSGQERPLQ